MRNKSTKSSKNFLTNKKFYVIIFIVTLRIQYLVLSYLGENLHASSPRVAETESENEGYLVEWLS